jgi:ADP-heptose:LPS heptosyltransferase
VAPGPNALQKPLFDTLPPDARVLFIRLRSMGDCLLLTGPLRALRKRYPAFRVSVLVEPAFADCFRGNPDVDTILQTGDSKLGTIRDLGSREFEAVINLHGGPTSFFLTRAVGAVRVGVRGYQYGWFYSRLLSNPNIRQHTVLTTADLFRELGVESSGYEPLRFEPDGDAVEWIRAALEESRIGNQTYAVVHPAALMSTKRWDAQRYAAIAKRLMECGLGVVLTAGPGEESVAGAVASGCPGSLTLLGLSIPRLAELIRGAALYLGNDSGPMHLAAAVGTPVVAPWGSSDSVRWRPWMVEHRVVQNPFDCNPCAGHTCKVAPTPLCIESVTVDQVAAAIDAVLLRARDARTPPTPWPGEAVGGWSFP